MASPNSALRNRIIFPFKIQLLEGTPSRNCSLHGLVGCGSHSPPSSSSFVRQYPKLKWNFTRPVGKFLFTTRREQVVVQYTAQILIGFRKRGVSGLTPHQQNMSTTHGPQFIHRIHCYPASLKCSA